MSDASLVPQKLTEKYIADASVGKHVTFYRQDADPLCIDNFVTYMTVLNHKDFGVVNATILSDFDIVVY